jgi:hypothetical protein
MAISEDTRLLIAYMQKNNELTEQIKNLAIKDDTPDERVKDQLPEILAERTFINKQMKQAKDLSADEKKTVGNPLEEIVKGLSDQNQEINDFLVANAEGIREFVDLQVDTLKELEKQTEIIDMNALGMKNMMESMGQQQTNQMKESLLDVKDGQEKFTMDLGSRILEMTPTPSQRKEERKEEQTKLSSMFSQLGGNIVKGFGKTGKSISDKISELNKGILGRVGFATVLFLLVGGLIGLSKRLSETVTGIGFSFGSIFRNLANFGETGRGFFGDLGNLLAEGFTAIGTTLAFFFRKYIIGFFFNGMKNAFLKVFAFFRKNELGKAMKALGKFLVRFIAFPITALLGMLDFINEFNKEMFDGSGSFLRSLGAGLMGIVNGVLNPIIELFKFLGKIIAIPMILAGNFVRELLNGNLISGDFSGLMRGVPFFGTPVPNIPAETITGVGGAGLAGNTGILIQTNNIDTSNKSETHQYSSTNITDSQAENTGL